MVAIAAIGVAWGLLATGVHLAVFGGLVPPPGQLALPFAIALVLADLPVLGALFLETGLGRSSPTLNEVTTAAIFIGVLLVFAIAAIIFSVRRAIG